MVTLCWAVKGGSGTTVVAATLALQARAPSLLVDLDGDLPTALGVAQSDRPGVTEWLTSSAPPDRLGELLVDIGDERWLLPCRAASSRAPSPDSGTGRWAELATWLADWAAQHDGIVVVDVGTREPPDALHVRARHSLLVTRACYLAILRAGRCANRPSGVVLVDEPGHGLNDRAIEHAVGVRVEARIHFDPAIARAVDAGLLSSSLPRSVTRGLRAVAA